MPFDFDGSRVSLAWVQENLQRTGQLLTGSVARVSQHKPAHIDSTSMTANLFELDIEYSEDASGNCPATALLKIARPELWETGAGKNEVLFYKYVLDSKQQLPVPACYGFELDEANRGSVLMLQRVTGTFETVNADQGERPGMQLLRRVVTSLASLHANWWETEVPAAYERFPYSRQKVDFLIGEFDFYNSADAFMKRAAPVLDQRALYAFEQYVSVFLDRLKVYLDEGRSQTIVHNDAHCWNFLVPVDKREQPVLLDWSSWDIDNATYDLVYAIVVRATPDIVINHEDTLIASYRERLAASGISYSDEDFWYDYRYSVTRHLVTPIILAQFVPGLPDVVWREMIPSIMAALDKHDCWELLA